MRLCVCVCVRGGGGVKWLSMQGCGRAACQAGSSSSLRGHSHDHVDHQLLWKDEESLGVVQEECFCACACGDGGMYRPGGVHSCMLRLSPAHARAATRSFECHSCWGYSQLQALGVLAVAALATLD